ncbi:uncharacterized protein LOC135388062 [Ornithodoros turicata]|uniref:uncharacterized protein LOC135388062 n=1 Tax=Ornithodoros turicata TaxID=34597 RepID=UPI0031393A3F
MKGPSYEFFDLVEDATRNVCRLFFRLTQEHKVPESACETAFRDLECLMSSLWEQFTNTVGCKIGDELLTTHDDLRQLLKCDFMKQLFAPVRTAYQREQFAKRHLRYVEPVQCHYAADRNESFQYVPVVSVIRNVLESPTIADSLLNPQPQCDSQIISSFRDGTLQQRRQDTRDPSTTYIILYSDELEVVNPIGPKRGVHKLLVVYFTFLELHPRFRSQVKHIHLAIVAKYPDTKCHLDVVLAPLVSDLNVLATDGMDITSPLGSRKIFVRVVGFCGDNLSMHAIGGFTCSFSCGRVCRYCLTRSSQLGEVKSERHCIVRDAKTHSAQLEAIQVIPDLTYAYGVREKSPLLELESFDVTRQLPPDVMHDMFEGTFVVIMHYTLRGLVEDNVLTAEDILRADTFPYGTNDNKNRPEKIGASFLSDSKSMRGSASQKWCLFRLMPLILGPIVPEGNDKWELFLTFRELADIILAEKMPSECPQYLEDKIEEFFMMFLPKYPNARVHPKLHYMVHYPRITSELGPLRQYWCFRFEAKHQFFKSHAARVHNYRNIPYTLAKKHQLLQSYQLGSSFMKNSFTATNLRPAEQTEAHPCAQHLFCGMVNIADSAKVNGLAYSKGDILVMKTGDDPNFAQVQQLYFAKRRFYLQVEEMVVETFCRHTFAYKLRRTGHIALNAPGDEASFQKLDLYFGGFVVPKWEIIF